MKTVISESLPVTILFLLFFLVVATPRLIRSDVSFIEEEYFEGGLIFIMAIVGYVIILQYRKEIKKTADRLSQMQYERRSVEDKLNDAFEYIGCVNVQIDAIRSIFNDINKYPGNKKEMKQIMGLLSSAALKIVSADWVLLRIVDLRKVRTIREFPQARGSAVLLKHEISNKDLIENRIASDYVAIATSREDMTIKTFCIFSKIKVTSEQKVLIEAIVNQLEMLFIIFDSRYYKYREINRNDA